MVDVIPSLWRTTTDVDFMREKGRDDDPSHRWVTERLAGLDVARPFSLLDCGVMSGVTYRELRRAGLPVDYVGIDIGAPVIDACRAEFPEAGWYEMSVVDLAFSDNSFQVVNCRHVLEHLPYYETAVREMFR